MELFKILVVIIMLLGAGYNLWQDNIYVALYAALFGVLAVVCLFI